MATMLPYGNVVAQNWLAVTLSPAQVAINTTAEQSFTVKGIRAGTDRIAAINKPTAQAGLGIVGFRVISNDTIGITFSNNTGGAITPTASQVYQIKVERLDGVTPQASVMQS